MKNTYAMVFACLLGFISEATLMASKESIVSTPMLPVEPFRMLFDDDLSPEERQLKNDQYHPRCNVRIVSAADGLNYALYVSADVALTSKNLDDIFKEVIRLQDNDLCFNDDVSPPCRIKEVSENDEKLYEVWVGNEPFVSSKNRNASFRVVKNLKRLRMCNYGSEYYLPPRAGSREMLQSSPEKTDSR